MNQEYYVSVYGNDEHVGSSDKPFRTISKAAQVAEAGDTITVHEGVYREWVKPLRGGDSNEKRIVYRAAKGEKVVIKGSEEISNWEICDNEVWKTSVSNEIFGEFNPFAQSIDGDWLLNPRNPFRHVGEVYLNGKALHEVFGIDEVKRESKTWYAEVLDKVTVIYANFAVSDPNEELTEINVRKCCFYPERTGLNYITVRGFEMAQAACTWAPPTAEQFGMLGVHWSKGWIIEDNILHDAKCSAVSLGKNATLADNLATKGNRKSGYQYQIENIFKAKEFGWAKENIGSHIVRNNTIYDCGQNGVVGQMGCVFSEIYHNHIYNIGNKEEFFGYEIAGIKFHAAIDVQIHDNYIHNCGGSAGIWLDWQTQGTRISRNLLRDNEKTVHGDLFIEVSHGPYMVDNNIFASKYNITSVSQGGAYIHNLFFGAIHRIKCLTRFTPYHGNHTVEVSGYVCVYGEDDRWYQNIFAGETEEADGWRLGTSQYNGCPTSIEEYAKEEHELAGEGSDETGRQPAYINGNCYFNGAEAFDQEKDHFIDAGRIYPQLADEDGKVYLEIKIPQEIQKVNTMLIGTENLEPPRISEQPYENPDGTPIVLDEDYFGEIRTNQPTPGPIEALQSGRQRILLWPKK
ncbi:MAG: right-handed parallel beta-helix repeat-containing protein [Clostridia bacterium]|nr:right-handed parallel beta-helix repeat-containing protein [Clostridia bacterium]